MDDKQRPKALAGMTSEELTSECHALSEECAQRRRAGEVVADALRIISYADDYIGSDVGGVLHMLARVLDNPEFLS